MDFIISTILFGILFLMYYVYITLTKQRGYLETLPIPLEKPGWLFGSHPMAYHKYLMHEYQVDLFKKHKSLSVALYAGSMPCIVTIDPAIIKEVVVKQFENFTDTFDFYMDDKYKSLDITGGEAWRELRKEMSPTFTSGKLKRMMEPMEKIADKFVAKIHKLNEDNSEINVIKLYEGYALDTISACSFGIESNAMDDPNDEILVNAKKAFANFNCTNVFASFMMNFMLHYPKLLEYINVLPQAFENLLKISKDLMDSRQENAANNKDFLSRLVELRNKIKDPSYEGVIKEDMIYPQALIFFIAGLETTAKTLNAVTYFLAKNPQIQENLYELVRDIEEINTETVNDVDYLNAVLMEALRMMPPVLEHDRCCMKDTVVNGIPIKKGTKIQMLMYPAHMNPDWFPNPHEFKPERFLKENGDEIKPYTWRPFGEGNRICIGMRFSMTEMKIALAKILKEFLIEPTDKTEAKFVKGKLFFMEVESMIVKFTPRS